MRKIVVVNIVSLDGYYEGPGGNMMALPMDEGFDSYNLDRMRTAGTVLLGGTSYRMFSGFWPAVENNAEMSTTNREFSKRYNAVPKIAVSNSLTAADMGAWKDTTTILSGAQVYADIAAMRQAAGNDIVIYGSRRLWNDLLAHGLIDEIHLVIGNVVLGGGTPVFVKPIAYDDPHCALKPLAARTFPVSGNTLVQYAVTYKDV